MAAGGRGEGPGWPARMDAGDRHGCRTERPRFGIVAPNTPNAVASRKRSERSERSAARERHQAAPL